MIGKGVQRVIKRNAPSLELRSDAQEDGVYDSEGNFVRGTRDIEFIKLHFQPLSGTEAQNLPENLRTKTVLNYWTIESVKVDVKKQVIIGNDIYSFETIKLYTSHTEGILTRSGKQAHKTT